MQYRHQGTTLHRIAIADCCEAGSFCHIRQTWPQYGHHEREQRE
jgi:hypothetical protein